jgi:TRAP-type C4-dicarboxylate transport system substrate-binding protein
MKKRQLVKWIAASLAIGASAFGLQAQAQSKMVLKASDVHPLGYPTVEAIVRMGKKLEAATNGRISMGVVLHGGTDDVCHLIKTSIVHFLHNVKDTALNGF